MLIEKLRLTFNYDVGEATVEASSQGFAEQRQLKEAQLTQLETVMENLVTSLASLSTAQMIAAVEKKYQEAQVEYDRLQHELGAIKASAADIDKIRVLKVHSQESLIVGIK